MKQAEKVGGKEWENEEEELGKGEMEGDGINSHKFFY